MQWHTLPVEAYGMTHTALYGRLPRILWITGNIKLYTRINIRAYGATPTTFDLTTLRLIRRAHMASRPSVQQAVHDRDDEYGLSQARGGEINTQPRMCVKGAACARSAVDIWGSAWAITTGGNS